MIANPISKKYASVGGVRPLSPLRFVSDRSHDPFALFVKRNKFRRNSSSPAANNPYGDTIG